MLVAWFIGLNMFFMLGSTQGAIISAVSKAFSAAVVQGTK